MNLWGLSFVIPLGSEFCHIMCSGDEVSFQTSFIYVAFLNLVVLTSLAK